MDEVMIKCGDCRYRKYYMCIKTEKDISASDMLCKDFIPKDPGKHLCGTCYWFKEPYCYHNTPEPSRPLIKTYKACSHWEVRGFTVACLDYSHVMEKK